MPPMTCAERKRKQRQRDAADPERKTRKLDTLFMFGCVDISVIVDNDGVIWFKGVDVARALEMENPNTAMYDVLDKEYCTCYESIVSDNVGYRDIASIQPKTTFVNEMGLNLFVIRSRKPKAESFAKWVCGEVLPSIRKTGKYEVATPDHNPYKELNMFLKSQLKEKEKELNEKQQELNEKQKELKDQQKEFKEQQKEKDQLLLDNHKQISTLVGGMMKKQKELKDQQKEFKEQQKEKDQLLLDNHKQISTLVGGMMKAQDQIFEMRSSCVVPLKNELKDEYLVIFRKFAMKDYEKIEDPEILYFPYYAARVQLDSLNEREKEIKTRYPHLEMLLKLKLPNSVNFFNYIIQEMGDVLERGKGVYIQSFRIIDPKTMNEETLLTMIVNLYRAKYGKPE